jgi:hypothetical protein
LAKGGHGRGNVGTVQDELKQEEVTGEGATAEEKAKAEEEEKVKKAEAFADA